MYLTYLIFFFNMASDAVFVFVMKSVVQCQKLIL